MSRESSHGIDYERMSGDARSFDADVPEADFEDPFAKVGSGPSYDNLPMTREDYGYGEAAQSRDSAATELSSGSSGSASVQSRSTSSADLYMSLNAGALGSGFGAQRQEKQYLAHERRSLWGQCSYNIGYSYFGGLALGGLYGVVAGVRASPNSRSRIVLNSVLNGAGKYGAKAGNAVGILALLFTVLERQLEEVEVDKLPGMINNALGMDVFHRSRADALIPAITAFSTGALFSMPRALTMQGVDAVRVTPVKRIAVVLTGGVASMLGVGALSLLGPLVFGARSPFRFA